MKAMNLLSIHLLVAAVVSIQITSMPQAAFAQRGEAVQAEAANEIASAEFPKPVHVLEAGSREYTATIRMGDQEMKMTVTRTVEEVDGNWRVTETAKGPMGEVSDSEVLAMGTLTPVERHTVQGPVEIRLNYTDEKVEGTFNMSGQQQDVNVDLDGPIYSDGAGSALVVSALPLAEGYEARYGTFDLMGQKVRPMKLAVNGVEEVTVPAGTFEAFRVDVQPASGDPGGSTLWVSTDGYEVVKVETRVPQMGGAVVTSELEPFSASGSE